MNFENAWCKETAHPTYQDRWSEDNPCVGQCLVTALVIQDKYGGDIYSCKVGRHSHFVNVIDDRIIDKTAEQFGDTDKVKYISGSFKKRARESLLKNQDVKQRYELLQQRIKEN
jgi:hypothetical protein